MIKSFFYGDEILRGMGIFEESEGNQYGGYQDCNIINEHERISLDEIQLKIPGYHNDIDTQSIIEYKAGEYKNQYGILIRMLYFLKVFADSPDVQNQAEQTAYPDDDIVRVHIESLPPDDNRFECHKGQDQLQEYFFFERVIENHADNRRINQVIKQNNSQRNGFIPVPVKNIRQVQNAIDHPENRNDHIGFIFCQLFAPVDNERQEGKRHGQ
jgi:hypothetical protein